MSGVDIDHGGAVSVDTAQVRDVAARLVGLHTPFDRAVSALRALTADLASEPEAFPDAGWGEVREVADGVATISADVERTAEAALLMADAYEVVELRARAEMLAHTDAVEAAAIRVRIADMVAADQRVEAVADGLEREWKAHRRDGLAGVIPQMLLTGAVAGTVSRLGRVRPGATLRGRADPVRVTAVATSAPRAPADLTSALHRLPSKNGAQIAVEKYAMPGGATRYVTYLTGTRSSASGGKEPWDMESNVELYTGTRSASYQATLDALAAAGAQPGDRVDVVGYSQSGMIAAHLSMESEFDVATQITLGSPVEPSVADDQTLVQLRHTDDIVSSLADGGSAAGTGSPDSFAASRIAGTPVGSPDPLGAHHLDEYLETARMVDTSGDPRAEVLDEYWTELGTAESIERTEYRAERAG